MVSKIKKVIEPIKKVLTRRKYSLIFLLTVFIFFSISILSKNFKTIIILSEKLSLNEFSSFLFSLYKGGIISNPPHSTTILLTISILLGLVVSLMFFKIDANKSFKGNLTKSGTIGAFLGVAAPVCAPCGIGLLSLVGIGGALLFLPFKGLEIGLLSIVLLSYSVISLGSDINSCNKCTVEVNKKRK
jgi:hypothetical protein